MEGKISQFLEKYKNLIPPNDTIRKVAVEEIKNATGASLEKKDVSVRNDTVFISAHPAIKNKILLKKGEILGRIREGVGKNPPIDIR